MSRLLMYRPRYSTVTWLGTCNIENRNGYQRLQIDHACTFITTSLRNVLLGKKGKVASLKFKNLVKFFGALCRMVFFSTQHILRVKPSPPHSLYTDYSDERQCFSACSLISHWRRSLRFSPALMKAPECDLVLR